MTPYFIAEIGSNHNGDLKRAMALVEAASDCSFWGVKFQLFRVKTLFAPQALKKHSELLERRRYEAPPSWLPILTKQAHTLGMKFGVTPCSLRAVSIAKPHVDFFKIGSYEAEWRQLVRACEKTGKKLFMSLGLCDNDVYKLDHWIPTSPDLTLMHCASFYPATPAYCNLGNIQKLRSLGHPVGWSDHTCNSEVVKRAVLHWGAEVVEMHLDLVDCEGSETTHSWLPGAAKSVIEICSMDYGDHINRKEMRWRRDPSDGLRPLKRYR